MGDLNFPWNPAYGKKNNLYYALLCELDGHVNLRLNCVRPMHTGAQFDRDLKFRDVAVKSYLIPLSCDPDRLRHTPRMYMAAFQKNFHLCKCCTYKM